MMRWCKSSVADRLCRGLALVLVWGLTLAATRPADMPAADYERVRALVQQMLSDPVGRVQSWQGADGVNAGEITVSPAIGANGMPCPSLARCVNPCRNVTYTFVGTSVTRAVVSNKYEELMCRSARGQWVFDTNRGRLENRTVLSAAPAPQPAKPEPKPKSEDSLKRSMIVAVQKDLKSLLYLDAEATGELDDPTMAALSAFLADEGLAPSGGAAFDEDELLLVTNVLKTAKARHRAGRCANSKRFVVCARAS